MCLALPARIEQRDDILAWVVIGEARMRISLIMTPEAKVGDWVLIHAGYAIRTVTEQDAIETWKIIESVETASVVTITNTTTAPRATQEVSP